MVRTPKPIPTSLSGPLSTAQPRQLTGSSTTSRWSKLPSAKRLARPTQIWVSYSKPSINGSALSIYMREGKYAHAQQLYGETLELDRRVLGARDKVTIGAMYSLGVLYTREGKY